MPTQLRHLSDSELEVMKVIWDHGPVTVRQIQESLPKRRTWAYTTVQTLVLRLIGKGYASTDKSHFTHLYQAQISREAYLGWRLRELARELCGGDTTPLLLELLEQPGPAARESQALRQALEKSRRGKAASAKRTASKGGTARRPRA